MSIQARQASEVFPILTPQMDLHAIPFNGPEFYEGLDTRFGDFSGHVLMSCHSFNEAWPTWECHPNGDEFVMLMAGSATMILKTDTGEESVELDTPGQYIIVPRGAWHTASRASGATMFFVTPGEGTQNLEQPPEG